MRGQSQNQHPLFPRKRTFRSAVGMSALCMVESKDITTFCGVAAARAAQIGWPEDFPPAILLALNATEVTMNFRIRGLGARQFDHLFTLSDAELAEHGAVRRIADGHVPAASALAMQIPAMS